MPFDLDMLLFLLSFHCASFVCLTAMAGLERLPCLVQNLYGYYFFQDDA